MRRDKYRQSDEKKFNTLYGSNFSRDTRELTPEQRRYLEIGDIGGYVEREKNLSQNGEVAMHFSLVNVN